MAVLLQVVASLRNRIRFEPILRDEAPALTPSAYDVVVFFSGTHPHTAFSSEKLENAFAFGFVAGIIRAELHGGITP